MVVLGVTVAHPGEMLERSRAASGELVLLLDFKKGGNWEFSKLG